MDNLTSQEFNSCLSLRELPIIVLVWFTVYLVFLPLFLFVLYIGFNKWKKPQSSASGGLSHSNVFTLHMVAMEMIGIVGLGATCYGFFKADGDAVSVGVGALTITLTGEMLFHSLTCVERYLAVVHPVTYLRLRGEGGVTIRNISIASVWAFSVSYSLFVKFNNHFLLGTIIRFVVAFAPLPLVAYCSIYVLCVLTRPKPGERGGPGRQIDQSKRSTVNTMAAILAALLLRLISDIIQNITYFSPELFFYGCLMAILAFWLSLPSVLVLPLLFLQRAGKLTWCQ